MRENAPDVKGITKTKLCGSFKSLDIGNGKYRTQKRNRMGKLGGGGVLLMVKKKDLIVEEVVYGKGCGKVVKVGILREEGAKKRIYGGVCSAKNKSME